MKYANKVALCIIPLVAIQALKLRIVIYLFNDPKVMYGDRQLISLIWFVCEDLIILLIASDIRKKSTGWLDVFWLFMCSLAVGKCIDEFSSPYAFSIGEVKWWFVSAYFAIRYWLEKSDSKSRFLRFLFGLKKME